MGAAAEGIAAREACLAAGKTRERQGTGTAGAATVRAVVADLEERMVEDWVREDTAAAAMTAAALEELAQEATRALVAMVEARVEALVEEAEAARVAEEETMAATRATWTASTLEEEARRRLRLMIRT